MITYQAHCKANTDISWKPKIWICYEILFEFECWLFYSNKHCKHGGGVTCESCNIR